MGEVYRALDPSLGREVAMYFRHTASRYGLLDAWYSYQTQALARDRRQVAPGERHPLPRLIPGGHRLQPRVPQHPPLLGHRILPAARAARPGRSPARAAPSGPPRPPKTTAGQREQPPPAGLAPPAPPVPDRHSTATAGTFARLQPPPPPAPLQRGERRPDTAASGSCESPPAALAVRRSAYPVNFRLYKSAPPEDFLQGVQPAEPNIGVERLRGALNLPEQLSVHQDRTSHPRGGR